MCPCTLEAVISILDIAATAGNAVNYRHVIFAIVLLVFQTLITAVEVAAGVPIFMKFTKHAQTFDNATASRSDSWDTYYHTWVTGFVVMCPVAASQLIHAIFCVARFYCCKDQHCKESIIIWWLRINFVFEFIFGDIMVSIGKILMAVESEKELLELQTPAGQLSSMATFVVTIIRFIIVFGTGVIHSLRAAKNMMTVIYDTFCLLAGLVALYTATFSMLISWSLYDVHYGDTMSHTVIFWMIGSVFLGCVGLPLLTAFIVCMKYKCKPGVNLSPCVKESDNGDEDHAEIDEHSGISKYNCLIGILMLYTIITVIESGAGLPIFMEFVKDGNRAKWHNLHSNNASNVSTTTHLRKYRNAWWAGYFLSWILAAIELVIAMAMIIAHNHFAKTFGFFEVSLINLFTFCDFFFGGLMMSVSKTNIAFESEKALLMLQTEAGQISSMATSVATVIRFLILYITIFTICVRGRHHVIGLVANIFYLLPGFLALYPVILSVLISWSVIEAHPHYNSDFMVTFMTLGVLFWTLSAPLFLRIYRRTNSLL